MTETMDDRKSYLTREIPGLAFVFLAVILFLALISHHPEDPSLSSYSTVGGQVEVKNYIGLFGAYFTGVLVDFFGLAAFWPALFLSATAWRFFRGRGFSKPWLFWTGLGVMLLTSAAALSMIFPRLSLFWPQTPGGGLLGDVASHYLVKALNPTGAGLLLACLSVAALIIATDFSVIRFFQWIRVKLARTGSILNEQKEKRREKLERSKRLREVLDRQKEREAPKLKKKPTPASLKPVQEAFEFTAPEGPYQTPPADLLDEPEKGQGGMSQEALMANARLVEKKLSDFNVVGEVKEVSTGPVITMYEYQPAPGVKISKVAGLSDDLAMNMRAEAIRVVPSIPGKAAIGIEIPNPKREFVFLKEVIESSAFKDSKSLLSLVLGVDTMGAPEVANLQKMPHLLIAGATGSGKSVGLNAIIMSILFKARPEEVKFLMIDPKRIELSLYKDLPHLIYPVISEPMEANKALKWAVADMENRYRLLAEKGVRNIEAYNKAVRKELRLNPPQPVIGEDGEEIEAPPPPEPLPYLVIIIDELADLMMVSAKEVEASITRLAQMARAAGIHLILATQRPSVDVLTGVIKANMPTRISFQVSSKIDSRTILDTGGAEKLLGMGDMLYLPPGTSKIQRIHGAYVSEEEIKGVMDFVKAQQAPDYLDELAAPESDGVEESGGDDYDEKYDEAVELVTRTRKASISLVQRHLRIGYNRAARIIETMEREGVVGPADGAKPRRVLAGAL